jgi:hypothetical protein
VNSHVAASGIKLCVERSPLWFRGARFERAISKSLSTSFQSTTDLDSRDSLGRAPNHFKRPSAEPRPLSTIRTAHHVVRRTTYRHCPSLCSTRYRRSSARRGRSAVEQGRDQEEGKRGREYVGRIYSSRQRGLSTLSIRLLHLRAEAAKGAERAKKEAEAKAAREAEDANVSCADTTRRPSWEDRRYNHAHITLIWRNTCLACRTQPRTTGANSHSINPNHVPTNLERSSPTSMPT